MTDMRIEIDRKHLPVQVEKTLIWDWMPVLGDGGFSLYMLYRTMGEDNEKPIGVRRLARHLHMSQTYIQLHSRVLVWSGLLAKISGSSTESNRFIMKAIPAVTPELLASIRNRAQTDKIMLRYPGFLRRETINQPMGLLDRIDAWRPWASVPVVASDVLQTQPVVSSAQTTDVLPPAAVATDADIVAQLAGLRGMRPNDAEQIFNQYDTGRLTGWIAWLNEQGSAIKNPAGYLWTVLRKNQEPPPVARPADVCPTCSRRMVAGECLYCTGVILS